MNKPSSPNQNRCWWLEKESKASKVWEVELQRFSPSITRRYTMIMDRLLSRYNLSTLEELYEMKLKKNSSGDPRDRAQIENMVKTLHARTPTNARTIFR